jgi:hypothetical protein
MKLEGIDKGNSFDWGKTSRDYAKYRDIYPVEFCITTRNFWRVVNRQVYRMCVILCDSLRLEGGLRVLICVR